MADILRGPWPGSPQQNEIPETPTVDNAAQASSVPIGSEEDGGDVPARSPHAAAVRRLRETRQREMLRLKVITAVHAASFRFSKDEIRKFCEQAFENVEARSDYR